MKCTIKVPAKINLSLDVVGKREDGYHLLETVMQSIDLYDIIKVSLIDLPYSKSGNIQIIADNPTFPCDSRNTCHRAAEQFIKAWQSAKKEGLIDENNQSVTNEKYNSISLETKTILIHITKNIPQAAGLAGGSADAAAVLTALNHLCGLPFTDGSLARFGSKVGADVPFCLTGGTVLCKGIGEILEPLPPLKCVPVVLVKPNFGVSTPWVFERLNINQLGKRPNTPGVVDAILEQNITELFDKTANVLESITLPAFPVLSRIKDTLLELGAVGALMSGSGPSVFGIFQTDEQAVAAVAKIKKISEFNSYTILKTDTVQNGPIRIDDVI